MFLAIKNFFKRVFGKKPFFCLVINDVADEDGRLPLRMEYNRAFIGYIKSLGFIGHNDDECVQLFMMSITMKPEAADDTTRISPTGHPNLEREIIQNGNVVRR